MVHGDDKVNRIELSFLQIHIGLEAIVERCSLYLYHSTVQTIFKTSSTVELG